MKTLTILVIEDQSLDRDIIKQSLALNPPATGKAWTIYEVDRLQAAIQQFSDRTLEQDFPRQTSASHNPIDIALLDLGLPDSHGLATLKHFRQAFQHLPVVVLTGMADKQLAIDALEAGAQDYLIKDAITGEQLEQSLHYAIERKKSQDQQIFKIQELRNQAEQKLQESQHLNWLSDKTLLMLFHEMCTPLSIMNAINNVLQTSSNTLTIEQRECYLERTSQALERSFGIVQDVRRLHQANSGTLSYTPQVIVVSQVIESIINQVCISTGFKQKIALKKPSSSLVMTADLDLFVILFRNLLVNASRYSSAEDTIHVFIRTCDQNVVFEICDTGLGIPPEDLPLVCQSFYRAKNVGTIPGKGIGLTIAQSCISRHGGTLSITSELGQGTQVIVHLPREAPISSTLGLSLEATVEAIVK
jgi:signal transduction histidine kinase